MSDLTDFRAEKDEFFRGHPQSPLTPEEKRGFKGLKYFPKNEALRLEVQVEKLFDSSPYKCKPRPGACRHIHTWNMHRSDNRRYGILVPQEPERHGRLESRERKAGHLVQERIAAVDRATGPAGQTGSEALSDALSCSARRET